MFRILLIFVGFISIGIASADQDKLKVSIYYETLCPDSIRFFRQQFDPVYKSLLPHVDFEFVPYGKARHKWENGKWNIQCQHGQKECVGNRFHSCELALGFGYEKNVDFITCSMRATNPTSFLLLRDCCKQLDLNFDLIDECFRNGTGHELLVKQGEKTAALEPKLSYVPTIVFNNVYNQTAQHAAERNFLKTVCEYLGEIPNVC